MTGNVCAPQKASGPSRDLPIVELSFDELGSGSDVLLLIHGHPFDRTMWSGLAEFAAGLGWRVVVPDLRGYGRSPMSGNKTTLDLFAADLGALLDRLAIETAVVGGLSMGGQIAMAFAGDFPDRVRGLFLAATFETPETDEGREARELTARRLLREGVAIYADELLPRMLAAATLEHNADVTAHVRSMMSATSAEGAAAALRGRAERPDYEPILRNFDKPSLIVVGDQDEFTTTSDAERMHGMLRQSELLVIAGAGHMPNLESPRETHGALERLLTRVRAAPAATSSGSEERRMERAMPSRP